METSLFKKLFLSLILILTVGLVVGCGKDTSKKLEQSFNDAELITLKDGDTLDSITQDVSLLDEFEGYEITYGFAPNGIILDDGTVKRPDQDTDVLIYASISTDEKNLIRKIETKVLKKEVKSITITFDYEGVDPLVVEVGKATLLPHIENKVDYKFLYWSDTESGAPVKASSLKEDTLLYPVFEPNFTITYLNTDLEDDIYSGEDNFNFKTIQDENFLYWSLTSNGEEFLPSMLKGSVSLYPVYKKEVIYTISFIPDEIESITYKPGEEISFPFGPQVAGKTFLHWSETENGDAFDIETISSDVTLYPVYDTVEAENITVTFAAEGIDSIVVAKTEILSLPEGPIEENKQFLYWSLTENGDEFDPSTLKEDITLYPVYINLNPIEFVYLNDLHGSILDTIGEDEISPEIGLARIAHFIKQKRLENPDLLFLTGGDILQGSALSNYYYGKSTLTLLEMMGLDFFTIGNHEFDWGLEKVTEQFGEDTTYSFPLVSCNVFYKGTDRLADNTVPYYIYNKGGHKIGIIGYIGQLMSSISASKTEDFEFRGATAEVAKWAKYLRVNENVDVVVAVGHQSSDASQGIRNLTGDERVDLVFSAHSHSNEIYQSEDKPPMIQSHSNGKAVGYVKMEIVNGEYKVTEITNYDYKQNQDLFSEEDIEVLTQIEAYQAEIAPIMEEVLISTPDVIGKKDFAIWLCNLMRVKTGAEVATYNYGGVRENIPSGNITVETLYKVIPFDNQIKSTLLKGDTVKYLGPPITYNEGLDKYSLDLDKKYRVVTNEYVFDSQGSSFSYADPNDLIIYDGIIRDWVADELRLQKEVYGTFDTENPILSEQVVLSGDINENYQVI